MKFWLSIAVYFLAITIMAFGFWLQVNETNNVKKKLAECSISRKAEDPTWHEHWFNLLEECEMDLHTYYEKSIELVCLEHMDETYSLIDLYIKRLAEYQTKAFRCEAELEVCEVGRVLEVKDNQ